MIAKYDGWGRKKTHKTEYRAEYPDMGWELPVTVDDDGQYYVEWSFATLIVQSLRNWRRQRKRRKNLADWGEHMAMQQQVGLDDWQESQQRLMNEYENRRGK